MSKIALLKGAQILRSTNTQQFAGHVAFHAFNQAEKIVPDLFASVKGGLENLDPLKRAAEALQKLDPQEAAAKTTKAAEFIGVDIKKVTSALPQIGVVQSASTLDGIKKVTSGTGKIAGHFDLAHQAVAAAEVAGAAYSSARKGEFNPIAAIIQTVSGKVSEIATEASRTHGLAAEGKIFEAGKAAAGLATSAISAPRDMAKEAAAKLAGAAVGTLAAAARPITPTTLGTPRNINSPGYAMIQKMQLTTKTTSLGGGAVASPRSTPSQGKSSGNSGPQLQ